jgi:hypothetical protein
MGKGDNYNADSVAEPMSLGAGRFSGPINKRNVIENFAGCVSDEPLANPTMARLEPSYDGES